MEILEHPVFGKIQEEDRVTVSYEGETLKARRGQTVASALIANGIVQFGRSRKLLQPRGLFCANGRCCSCYMTIGGKEHIRACMVLVEEGMLIKRCEGDPDLRKE